VTFSNRPAVATVKASSKERLARMALNDRASNNTGKSSSHLKILYGEGDAEVLATQAVSIQKAGHQVETAVGRKAIHEAVRRGTFDLVVLGPTLTRNDRHHLPYVIKKVQPTRILVMHTDGERHPAVDGNTDTGRSMADVVSKIASLMASAESPQKGVAKGAAAGK